MAKETKTRAKTYEKPFAGKVTFEDVRNVAAKKKPLAEQPDRNIP